MTHDGEVILGDCLEVLATLEAESVDSIVTDPPYGIRFMGKAWDGADIEARARSRRPRDEERTYIRKDTGKPYTKATTYADGASEAGQYDLRLPAQRAFQEWCEEWARELLRVAKPGAHLLVFGGTRTYHRLTAGLEDAGWEIRDCLVWAYASGFPKSLDMSKAIDRHLGHSRQGAGQGPAVDRGVLDVGGATGKAKNGLKAEWTESDPITPEAAAWQGWGMALKPAWEPIVLARKPLRGTVAANVLAHGTGALNIDATRIGTDVETWPASRREYDSTGVQPGGGKGGHTTPTGSAPAGRWPANVVLTDPLFDGDVPGVVGGGWQSGGGAPANRLTPVGNGITLGRGYHGEQATGLTPVDTDGTYSRFFLIPKAARADREPQLRGQVAPKRPPGWSSGEQSPGTFQSQPTPARENVHPTVKPTELMRHLVRLVTPPGGLVLDPFLGSGTTAVAAELEGFRWLGIEREAEYVAIARARLNGTQRGLGLVG